MFKIKKNGIYRARLVGLGYSQVPGVDFSENFSPVINDVTFRTLLALMLARGWKGKLIDVETAFLYGDLEEEVYMKCPEGLEEFDGTDPEETCVLLEKSIYGLVQAARNWWKKFMKTLTNDLGFVKTSADSCLLKRENENGTVILCIYVDDVCCVGDEAAIDEAIAEIEKIYTIKKLGEMKEYVRVTVERTGDQTMWLSQPDTLEKMEENFERFVKDMKVFSAPAAQGSAVIRSKSEEGKLKADEQKLYRSGVGMLLWLTKHSRPDLSNAVREASKVMDGATQEHLKYLLRIVKYALDTKKHKLLFNCKATGD